MRWPLFRSCLFAVVMFFTITPRAMAANLTCTSGTLGVFTCVKCTDSNGNKVTPSHGDTVTIDGGASQTVTGSFGIGFRTGGCVSPDDGACNHMSCAVRVPDCLQGRVPQVVLQTAVANPFSVEGYLTPANPALNFNLMFNRPRMCLALRDQGKPYNPLYNGLVFKPGCPCKSSFVYW